MAKKRRGTRIPPKPRFYYKAKPGQCRFCGKPILKNGYIHKRAQWHPACALTWTIMNSPQDARKFVFVRDRGICVRCNMDCSPRGQDHASEIVQKIMQGYDVRKLGKWQLDHITPLFASQGNPDVWKIGNMQTLCGPCHTIKSQEDNQRYSEFICQ